MVILSVSVNGGLMEATRARSALPPISFNAGYALLVAAIIFYGFGHTVGSTLIHYKTSPPPILYLHAILASLWVLLFVLQTFLVGARHVRLHRRIGPWGLALGCAVILVGAATAIVMRQRSVAEHGATPDVVAFLAVPLFNSLLSFAIPFLIAAALRKRAQWHRPMMLIGATALTMAAQARIPWMPPPVSLVITDGLMIVAALHDWGQRRRLSPAWYWGIPAMAALQAGSLYLAFAAPAGWVKIAGWILRTF
jgi:hypothetical protein